MAYLNTSHDWHIPAYWDGPKTFYGSDLEYNWCGNPALRQMLNIYNFDENTEKFDNGNQVALSFIQPKWLCPSSQLRGFSDQQFFKGQPYQSNYVYGMNVEGIDTGIELDTVRAPWATPTTAAGSAYPHLEWHAYRRGQVVRPSDKLMFTDAMYPFVNAYGSGVQPGWNKGTAGKVSNYDRVGERTNTGTLPDGSAYNSQRTTAWRHEGGANVCFFDGHVEWLTKDRIYLHDSSGNIIANPTLWVVWQ